MQHTFWTELTISINSICERRVKIKNKMMKKNAREPGEAGRRVCLLLKWAHIQWDTPGPGVPLELAPGRTNQAIKTVFCNPFRRDVACEVASYDFVRKYLWNTSRYPRLDLSGVRQMVSAGDGRRRLEKQKSKKKTSGESEGAGVLVVFWLFFFIAFLSSYRF